MSKVQQIARLREATGMGWLAARMFLAGKPAELCERIVTAKEKQKEGLLHDPIEDDPTLADQFVEVNQRAEEAYQIWVVERNARLIRKGLIKMVSEHPLGGCHFLWREKSFSKKSTG